MRYINKYNKIICVISHNIMIFNCKLHPCIKYCLIALISISSYMFINKIYAIINLIFGVILVTWSITRKEAMIIKEPDSNITKDYIDNCSELCPISIIPVSLEHNKPINPDQLSLEHNNPINPDQISLGHINPISLGHINLISPVSIIKESESQKVSIIPNEIMPEKKYDIEIILDNSENSSVM